MPIDENIKRNIRDIYRLFAQGKSPVEVLKELRLSETDATNYYMEYLRLSQLPGLSLTFKELSNLQ
jgi:hypothetical protein